MVGSIVVVSIVVGSIVVGSIVVVGRSRSVGLGTDPVASHSNLTASQYAGVPPSPSYFLFYPFLSVRAWNHLHHTRSFFDRLVVFLFSKCPTGSARFNQYQC